MMTHVNSADAPRRWSESLLAIWRYRELLRSLIVRNLKIKYQGSALGFVWTLLNPILTLAVLVAVFSYIVRIPLESYWAFLVSGYFVWNFVMQTLNTGTYVIAEHGPLRRSVAFPSAILVLGATGARLVEFGAEMVLVFAALILIHHQGVPPSFAGIPLLLTLQLLMTLGLVMPIATLSVFYTDVQHALPIALLTLFYLSPVFYPAEMVPDAIRTLYFLNPIAGLMTLHHVMLYEGALPSAQLLGATTGVAVFLFIAGYAIFHRYEPVFAEVV